MTELTDTDLVERAVRNAKAQMFTKWAAVREIFAVGSSTAAALCRRFGFDPDASASTAESGQPWGAGRAEAAQIPLPPDEVIGQIALDLIEDHGLSQVSVELAVREGFWRAAAARNPERTESVAAQAEVEKRLPFGRDWLRCTFALSDADVEDIMRAMDRVLELDREAHQGAEPVVAGKGSTHWYACPHCDKPIDPPAAPDAREALERAALIIEEYAEHIKLYDLQSERSSLTYVYEAMKAKRDARLAVAKQLRALIPPTPSTPT